jgi:hypothetical protein
MVAAVGLLLIASKYLEEGNALFATPLKPPARVARLGSDLLSQGGLTLCETPLDLGLGRLG